MKKLKKIWMGALSVALLSLAFLGIFSHKSLAAPITIFVPRQAWQIDHVSLKFGPDRSTIIATFPEDTIGGQRALGGTVTFKDGDPTDNTFRYTPTSPFCNTGSHGGIWFNQNGATTIGPTIKVGDTVKAYVDLDYLPDTAILDTSELGSCKNTTDGNQPNGNNVLDVSGASVLNDALQWDSTDHATLRTIGPLGGNDLALDYKNYTFTPTGTDSIMRNGTDPCSAVAVISADNKTANIYFLYAISSAGSTLDWTQVPELQSLANNSPNQVCYVGWANSVANPKLSDINNLTPYGIAGSRVPPSKGGVGSGAATTTGASDTQGCAISSDFNWILCPVITGLSNAADSITGIVEGQLNFNIGANLGKSGGSVEKAWTVFKNLVSALLVIVMLVMVISQAVGGGVFEPYTVKKLLPKLVVAIIAMQLSWVICIWLIGLANDAGQGIAQLLAAPFGGQAELTLPNLLHRLSVFWGSSAGILSTGALGIGVVSSFMFGAAILSYGWPIVVLAGFAVFMSVIVALATLLFRNALIVLLVIMSPLAFLALVLPGTNKYWKMWKDNFSKLLIFFPLVMSMIYGGRIFAWIAGNLGGAGPLDLIMVLLGFFGPYFFLPKTFKWGGSALALANKAVNESWPIRKGREVGTRELLAAQKRKADFRAAEYTDEDPFRTRLKNSLLAGRFIPTRRAKGAMIARGNEYKSKESDLEQAIQSRRREKAASRGQNVMAGKQMDLDAISKASRDAADAYGREDVFAAKAHERTAKEAMRDLISTGSTLELNNQKITDSDGKQKYVWQTKMWADLLNSNPELYREIKGQAPDWVPHRTPTGLPGYRGEYGPEDEARQRSSMAARGMGPAEINAEIAKNKDLAEFRRTAGGHPDLVDDVQWASSLNTTVEELDAQALGRVHPTYFERIGDMAQKGHNVRLQAEAATDPAEKASLTRVAETLEQPSVEFGKLISRLAKESGGRQHLAAVMGGADTMEHLDYALQYSGAQDASGNVVVKTAAKKGTGSMEAIMEAGERDETIRNEQARTGGSRPPEDEGPAPASSRREPGPRGSGGSSGSGGGFGFGPEPSPRRSGESGSFHAPGAEASATAGGTKIDHQLNETLLELAHAVRQNTAAVKEVGGVRQPTLPRGIEIPLGTRSIEPGFRPVESARPEPGEEIKPQDQQ